MIQLIDKGSYYEIGFSYNPKVLDAVKAIPGRRFNYNTKSWTAPKSSMDEIKHLVKQFGLVREDDSQEVPEPEPLPELTVEIPLKRELFPYQKNGVAYALEKKRLIIGDEPGLGKTGQAIATITAADAFPCLVIYPSSLKINWVREWELWTNYKAIVLDDKIKNSFVHYWNMQMAHVFVVNYESLKKFFVSEVNIPKGQKLKLNHISFRGEIQMFKSVIIDESHRVKETKTMQTKLTAGICKGKDYVLALTGTPVVNRPKDLISQLGIIQRLKDMGGYSYFMERYCGGSGKGAFNLKELNYKLTSTCFFRRDKSSVLKDLPDKMRSIVLCEITTKDEYKKALDDLEGYMKEYRKCTDAQIQQSMKAEIMVRIGILKNISARGKLNDVIDYIDNIIDEGQKIVVFVHLKEVAQKLMEHYPDALSVRGCDSQDDRQQSVDAFQNDPEKQIIICSIKAAGVGLTLTASSRVAFVELPWHAADTNQCEDRCHRIGQKDSVQCIYFLGQNTIDQQIYKIIDSKREIAKTITGSKENVLTEIIDNIDTLFNQNL